MCAGSHGAPAPRAGSARLTWVEPPLRLCRPHGPVFSHDERRRAESCAFLPGPHPHSATVLGRARLRDPAALRHGGGRGHVPPRHDPAGARAEAVAGGPPPAPPPAPGRPLPREPPPAPAPLPVPGEPE